MKNLINKILLLSICFIAFGLSYSNAWNVPSFYDNFTKYFTSNTAEGSDNEIVDVYVFEGVSVDRPFHENLRCLFYPSIITPSYCNGGNRGGAIWNIIRYIGYALVVIFVVISGIKLLTSGSNPDKVKSSLSSLLYIILGSVLFFGCIWILGSVLKFESVRGTEELTANIQGNEGSLLFFILSFAKAFAFIAAILMIVIHGFKMMSSADKSDKVKAGLKGLLNVIIALVIIKVIDYVYYMAQLSNLVSEATTLIIEIAKVAGFIIGALMVIMLFYAGFLLITDQGNSENMKKAKNIIIGILVTALVIFSLLLIIYEIFKEFA